MRRTQGREMGMMECWYTSEERLPGNDKHTYVVLREVLRNTALPLSHTLQMPSIRAFGKVV